LLNSRPIAKKILALIGLKSCSYDSKNTELARAVDDMTARAKGIYILWIKVNKRFRYHGVAEFFKTYRKQFVKFL